MLDSTVLCCVSKAAFKGAEVFVLETSFGVFERTLAYLMLELATAFPSPSDSL